MEQKCEVIRLGVMPYEQAWRLQDDFAAQIHAGKRPATLLLLEHPPTYTFGRSGHSANLLWDEAELARRGISLYWVDRGGDVTYHGPGQLVGYPLLPLAQGGLQVESMDGKPRLPQADYVGYVRKLEQTLIKALACLEVASKPIKGMTGVWVQPDPQRPPAKIAAIGVKVDAHGVSRHGFALNVNPDMSYWEGIIGCGLKDFPVTCLAELLHPVPPIEQVMDEVVAAFESIFGYEMVAGSYKPS